MYATTFAIKKFQVAAHIYKHEASDTVVINITTDDDDSITIHFRNAQDLDLFAQKVLSAVQVADKPE